MLKNNSCNELDLTYNYSMSLIYTVSLIIIAVTSLYGAYKIFTSVPSERRVRTGGRTTRGNVRPRNK